jgi:hypothetical protein
MLDVECHRIEWESAPYTSRTRAFKLIRPYQKAETEFYRFVEEAANAPAPVAFAPATMNVVLRTTVPAEVWAQTIESVIREVDRTVPIVRLRDMDAAINSEDDVVEHGSKDSRQGRARRS